MTVPILQHIATKPHLVLFRKHLERGHSLNVSISAKSGNQSRLKSFRFRLLPENGKVEQGLSRRHDGCRQEGDAMDQIFSQDHVLLGLEASCAEDVFRAVAERAEKLGVAPADGAYDGLLKREREVATGLMDGYAIPHTKCEAVCRAAMFYVRTARPLEWQTMDDEPVQHLFVLMAPDGAGGEQHLKLLSALATCLLEDEFKQAIAQAATAEDVVSLVMEHIKKEGA